MKNKLVSILAVIIYAVCTVAIFAQADGKSAQPAPPLKFFPLADLREGMRGKAFTVFSGTNPTEFNVEILGVLPGGVGPKQDLIIGRISGGGADRTAVFAGMSGSPVYIDGKLLGALSYSFPLSKEAICGITPIDQMVSIFEQYPKTAKGSSPKPVSIGSLLPRIENLSTLFPQNQNIVSASSRSFQPIGSPLSFGGLSQKTIEAFTPQLSSLGLVPAGAVSTTSAMSEMKRSDENTLTGGASVTVHLTRGDYNLAASGTVTMRDGEKIYAFGHPFLGIGTGDMPMSESHVVTVVPSISNSFKIAVPDALVGTMTQDRATGIYGKLGQTPTMIPVALNITTSRGKREEIRYEAINDPILTPILVNIGIFNALSANERAMGESTVKIDGEIQIQGADPVKIDTRFGSAMYSQFAGLAFSMPMSAILRGEFENLKIKGVTINATVADGAKTAQLEKLTVDKAQIRAGENFVVTAFSRLPSGAMRTDDVSIQIPKDAAAGTYSINVADGTVLQNSAVTQQLVPQDLNELVALINSLKKPDLLYLQMFRQTPGAIIGANEMPNLPPSVIASMNSDRAVGAFKPTVQTLVKESEFKRSEVIISGSQTIQIQVVK